MAKIFVSHSGKDQASNNFFHKAFSLTLVQSVFFEFETYYAPPGPEIERQIKESNAVFIILSPNAAELPHTRSWINWEAGIASGVGRDIWVFEPYPAGYDIPIPRFDHYMVFADDPVALQYIRSIIRSYEDSAVLPAALVGGAAGASLLGASLEHDEERGAALLLGGIGGALAGALLASKGAASQRPLGSTIRCPNPQCQTMFQMHTQLQQFPCPACRQWMVVPWGLPSLT